LESQILKTTDLIKEKLEEHKDMSEKIKNMKQDLSKNKLRKSDMLISDSINTQQQNEDP